MKEKCEDCRFFDADGIRESGPMKRRYAECRRRCPVVNDNGSEFPQVYVDQWCGEFEPRKKEE